MFGSQNLLVEFNAVGSVYHRKIKGRSRVDEAAFCITINLMLDTNPAAVRLL